MRTETKASFFQGFCANDTLIVRGWFGRDKFDYPGSSLYANNQDQPCWNENKTNLGMSCPGQSFYHRLRMRTDFKSGNQISAIHAKHLMSTLIWFV